MAASFRLSSVTAQTVQASFRLSSVQAVNGTPPTPAASFRLSSIQALNTPQGDCWVMSGGVWFPAVLHYRAAGVWS